MLIYANKIKHDSADLIFFLQQKRNYYLDNYKNYQLEILRRWNARAERTHFGYHGTPLCS